MDMNSMQGILSMLGLAGAGGMAGSLFGGAGMLGTKDRVEKHNTMSDQQINAANSQLSQGMQNTNWDDIQKNEINRFNTETIPGISELFTGMGGSGQRSSGFQHALMQGAAGLGSNLASQRSQFGMNQLNMGMRPQFENMHRPGQAGGLESGLSSIAQLLPLLMFL